MFGVEVEFEVVDILRGDGAGIGFAVLFEEGGELFDVLGVG